MGGLAYFHGDRARGAVGRAGLFLGVSEQNPLAKVNSLVHRGDSLKHLIQREKSSLNEDSQTEG